MFFIFRAAFQRAAGGPGAQPGPGVARGQEAAEERPPVQPRGRAH